MTIKNTFRVILLIFSCIYYHQALLGQTKHPDSAHLVLTTKKPVKIYSMPEISEVGVLVKKDRYLIAVTLVKGETGNFFKVISPTDKIAYVLIDNEYFVEPITAQKIRFFDKLNSDSDVDRLKNVYDSRFLIRAEKAVALYEKEKEEKIRKSREQEKVDSVNAIKQRVNDSIELVRVRIEYDSLSELVVKKHSSKGVIVSDWNWYYEKEYSYATSVRIVLLNPTKKRIKYVWVTFIAFDAVGGRLTSFGKNSVTVKAIGPIESVNYGEYEFEDIFASKVIDKMKIQTIKVQYFDGTYKTVKG